MLSNHSELCCGPETQFFNKTNFTQLDKELKSPNWKTSVYNHLKTLTLSGQPIIDLYNLSHKEIICYLKDKQPCIQVTLEVLCDIYAKKHGKIRWIEKTPNHILHLAKIRELYPKAKIIRIIRDPRDSAMSMARLPWTSHSFIENCFLWKKWYINSIKFIQSDKQTLEIRYEDLVIEPKKTLDLVCDFCDIEFELSMLDTSHSGKMVSSKAEPWKSQVSKPIDTKRVTPWKKELPSNYIYFSSFYFSSILKNHNYEKTNIPLLKYPQILTLLLFRKLAERIKNYNHLN
jgi:hypothetical protein